MPDLRACAKGVRRTPETVFGPHEAKGLPSVTRQPFRTAPSPARYILGLRLIGVSSVAFGLCFGMTVHAAQTEATGAPSKTPPAAESSLPQTRSIAADTREAPAPSGDDTMMRNAAARTRMLECGHQWSAKKKNGTAVGTWKEFFKTCLARQ